MTYASKLQVNPHLYTHTHTNIPTFIYIPSHTFFPLASLISIYLLSCVIACLLGSPDGHFSYGYAHHSGRSSYPGPSDPIPCSPCGGRSLLPPGVWPCDLPPSLPESPGGTVRGFHWSGFSCLNPGGDQLFLGYVQLYTATAGLHS